ncbi:MAG: SCO7613 C-terminal domain-containing membrane protein, partial [Natronosporangium sp.]
ELAAVEGLGGYVSMVAAVVLALGSTPDLAALLVGVGAVLGLAAVRPGRSHRERRILLWTAAISEVVAWWIIMRLFEVGLLEAYTLPFALFALLVGALEVRFRPELGSWFTYGPGLVAAFAPSLLLVITTTTPSPTRQIWVILGGVATLLLGSRLRQRAPLIIGTVVTAIAALHLLSLAGPWLMLIPLGLLLLVLGANREKRQRDLERLRGAYSRMR